jgi:hypothetical protein
MFANILKIPHKLSTIFLKLGFFLRIRNFSLAAAKKIM